MQHEIPDVVLPEPILPPCLAYELGRDAQPHRPFELVGITDNTPAPEWMRSMADGAPHPIADTDAYLVWRASQGPAQRAALEAAIRELQDEAERDRQLRVIKYAIDN